MIGTKAKYRRLEKALSACEEFDSWCAEYDEADNIKAKETLTAFFKELLKIKPDKKLILGYRRSEYYSFYINVLLLREALRERNYPHACNELISLCFYEPYLQIRIYLCLKRLYYEYLEE